MAQALTPDEINIDLNLDDYTTVEELFQALQVENSNPKADIPMYIKRINVTLLDPEVTDENKDYLTRLKTKMQGFGRTLTIDETELAGGRRHRGSKKAHKKSRKGNKMLSSWVAFVKKVQRDEQISYSDAMKRASARKKEWKRGQMGGEGVPAPVLNNYDDDSDESSDDGMGGGRRRRRTKRRGSSKRRGSRRRR
jgi:hypothetical protein